MKCPGPQGIFAGGEPFVAQDEEPLREFASSFGIVLESWWRMTSSPLIQADAAAGH